MSTISPTTVGAAAAAAAVHPSPPVPLSRNDRDSIQFQFLAPPGIGKVDEAQGGSFQGEEASQGVWGTDFPPISPVAISTGRNLDPQKLKQCLYQAVSKIFIH